MDNHGALVGWTHQDHGDRVLLTFQSRQAPGHPEEFDSTRLLMTKQQATVLANYLFEVSGQSPPAAEERSWFKRMFG